MNENECSCLKRDEPIVGVLLQRSFPVIKVPNWRQLSLKLMHLKQVGLVALSCLFLFTAFGSSALADNFDKEDLQGRNFAQRDLTSDSFVKANLKFADLRNVKAMGTSLFGANLAGTDLSGADLSEATLDMANLRQANLKNALFVDSLMWMAKMENSDIEGADFTNALMRSDTQADLCERASGTNPVTGVPTRDSLDCD